MRLDDLLKTQLSGAFARRRRFQLWSQLASGWAVIALVACILLILEKQSGWGLSYAPGLLLGCGLLVAFVLGVRWARNRPDWRELAHLIEKRRPQLEGRLLTAVQQNTGAGVQLNYLQQRLIQEALQDAGQNGWTDTIPASRIAVARAAHWVALGICVLVLWNLPRTHSHSLLARISDYSVTVNPGDVTLERGSSLVVMARFAGAVPPGVELVISQPPAPGTRRVPLVKSLADPVFGGSVAEVVMNLTYFVQYAGGRTHDFQVKVFDYPRLERADIDVTYPEYTGQSPTRIENTRRLSAVEGSHVDLELKLNKPVMSARLVAKDGARSSLPLVVETNRAGAFLKQFPLLASQHYDLQLLDAEGRTNRVPAQFVFEALTNRRPEIRLASPRGDLRPSAIEEIVFDGTVWDDFGVAKFGLAYALPGKEPQFIELGQAVPAKEKRPFKYVLHLEDIGVETDQLLTWFAWADDTGPDGHVRRTETDLYFAEVRPFEEVFREGQQPGGEDGQSGQRESQNGRLVELQKKILSATWNLQRQHGISTTPGRSAPSSGDGKSEKPATETKPAPARQSRLNAPQSQQLLGLPGSTRLILGQAGPPSARTAMSPALNTAVQVPPRSEGKRPTYQEDAAVLRDSQGQALEQAEAASSEARDPRAQALWADAVREMERALMQLNQATNSPAPLPDALAAERAAYQALLRLQEHEYQVLRSRRGSRGGGGGNEQMQRQLEQMDLAKSEDRYETQRQAQKPQNQQFREQLQVMNRLQELARRQDDLNERLKELQTALQEARTEQEREEIRRRLKRLQEEQEQMLADVDELRQRMDRPENQARMADERKQLDQTREDLQRAAQASSQGDPSQALAAGTRAQRQLQQLREQMRKESSSQFSDDLRELRTGARELARAQDDLVKRLGAEDGGQRKSLSDAAPTDDLLKQLSQQKERMTNLVERATQVSQQAEDPEPLLSRQLYDTVRKFSQENQKSIQEAQEDLISRRLMTSSMYDVLKNASSQEGPKLLDLTSELLRENNRGPASETAQRARATIEQFKSGVERAAESILGDDTEALRLAQQELEQLTRQLAREMAQSESNSAATNGSAGPGAQAGKPAETQSQPAAGTEGSPQLSQNNTPGDNKNVMQNSQPTGRSGRESEGQPTPDRQSPNGQQAGAAVGNRPAADQAATQASSSSDGGSETPRAWIRDFGRSFNDDRSLREGPISGGAFGPWSDRLREVEEIIDFPDLRNQVATAREHARLLRQALKRERTKPDWAVVQVQVMKPLLEVRDRLAEELARRESADALVPIDRDPVPVRYSDLVRHYYEELGKERGQDKKVLSNP
jgi:hypothetical protein